VTFSSTTNASWSSSPDVYTFHLFEKLQPGQRLQVVGCQHVSATLREHIEDPAAYGIWRLPVGQNMRRDLADLPPAVVGSMVTSSAGAAHRPSA
jgi:hypothetical protein